jgi:hypothetical protein
MANKKQRGAHVRQGNSPIILTMRFFDFIENAV